MKVAIITGASSGIGKEFAIQLAQMEKQVDEIWAIARSKERLQKLKEICPKKVCILTYDLEQEDSFVNIQRRLQEYKPRVIWLVNSAGYGIRKIFFTGTLKEEIGMLDVNCVALTTLTYLVLPYMSAGSHIVQLASAAAFLPQPGFAVYSASKSYVFNFSRALHRELKKKNISVTAVCSGPVQTEFFKRSDAGGNIPAYKHFFMAAPKKVVSKAIRDAKKKKAVSIYGFSIKLLRLLVK